MTALTLHDTMRRAKVPFTPLDAKNVRVYVCGPTVYDDAHIGNARPVVVFDVLFRVLRQLYGPDHVAYVRNITDVDDKIIDRARRDHPDLDLNDAIARVTERTAERFQTDATALRCLTPTHEPRATAHIGAMADMIRTLIERDHAYVADGGKGREVLFAVSSDANYGALSNRRLEDQQAGARVAVEDHKRHPADFVLWKESGADEPGWDETFDGLSVRGRPGWHIECSAMSKALLGDVFDIHGGGLDLIFPHHENEIAQSCCANGTERMAQVWMHNEFLRVEGAKMSKSEGNFFTIADVLRSQKVGGRTWPGPVVRLALLMTHYREPIDFSVSRLEEAEAVLRSWKRAANDHRELFAATEATMVPAVLLDDLNTAALPGRAKELIEGVRKDDANAATELKSLWSCAGFDDLLDTKVEANGAVGEAIRRRLDALNGRDFAEADRIRAELRLQGYEVRDGRDPDTGERTMSVDAV